MRAMMHPTLFLPAGFQLAITVLLAVFPIISATDSSQFSRRGLGFVNQQRDAGKDSGSLPAGWRNQSCYTDDPNQPMLTSISFMGPFMTVALCTNACADAYLAFAGLENGNKCSCGNVTTDSATIIPDSNCETHCAGNLTDPRYCGGPNGLQLYWNGKATQPNPTIVQNMGQWNLKGCYGDAKDARTLALKFEAGNNVTGGVTVEDCLNECGHRGFPLAGVEFANECWCGSLIGPSATSLDLEDCSVLACAGNSVEYCGAALRIIVYSRPAQNGA